MVSKPLDQRDQDDPFLWLRPLTMIRIFLLALFLVIFNCSELQGQKKKVSHKRIFVAGGTFKMGHQEIHETETPAHKVTLADFEMDCFEVTNLQFAQFIQAGGYSNQVYWQRFGGWELLQSKGWKSPRFWNNKDYNQPNQPVVGITWYEAAAYCEWLGDGSRLPTEAEWEYVATNGGKKVTYPWGNSNPEIKGVVAKCHFLNIMAKKPGPNHSLPVGSFKASRLGFYDLSGNVWEWCIDWFGKDYYQKSIGAINPKGPTTGVKKVLRGGSFNSTKMTLRAGVRYGGQPKNWYRSVGFRTVRSVSKG